MTILTTGHDGLYTHSYTAGHMDSQLCWILVDRKPVREPDPDKWSEWDKKNDRVLRKTTIDNVTISTVFLGIDCYLKEGDSPRLFETMARIENEDGSHVWLEQSKRKFLTWDEAMRHHERECHDLQFKSFRFQKKKGGEEECLT